jgi:hypothetical protein
LKEKQMWEVQGAIWIILAFYLIGDLLVKLFIKEPFIYRWGLFSRFGKVGYWILFSIWGFGLIYFSASTILSRALIEVDGTIVRSEEGHLLSGPHRKITTYTIEPENGGETITYVAYGAEPSLALHLPVGTRIEKGKWKITYTVNDEIIEDFPTQHFINYGCLGVLLVLINLIRICYLYYDQVFR